MLIQNSSNSIDFVLFISKVINNHEDENKNKNKQKIIIKNE
jgi:hypothetical protein